MLYSFDGSNGAYPYSGLIADRNGDLFGTTEGGGAYPYGTVFELVKSGATYTVTTLAHFDGSNGAYPYSGLIADANGDLFGTTSYGGAGYGTVFELVKSGTSYTLKTLVSFDGMNGNTPNTGLIIDTNGDLFGTTEYGGGTSPGYSYGNVFELVKAGNTYTLKNVVDFDYTNNGAYPNGLVADAQGNLFGTTNGGGADYVGTVFEITNSGFVVGQPPVMLDAIYNPSTDITTLSGTAEANSTVAISDGGKQIGTTTATANGTWRLPVNVKGNVIHSYTETSTDSSENILSSTCVALYAPAANKVLTGGSGNDVLIGQPNDKLTGNGGSDTFVFNPGLGKETITDFNVNQDTLWFAQSLFPHGISSSQIHDTKAGAVIVVDANDAVTLTGVTAAAFEASNAFHFF